MGIFGKSDAPRNLHLNLGHQAEPGLFRPIPKTGDLSLEDRVVPLEGIEPPTFALRKRCSTPELQRHALAF